MRAKPQIRQSQIVIRRTQPAVQAAFTLIELLTVIAIIAVLAALLFPVFNRARNQAKLNACMTQMHDIGVSVKLFYEDNERYPDVLLAYAQRSDMQFTAPDGTTHNEFLTAAVQPLVALDQNTYRPLLTGKHPVASQMGFLCPVSTNIDPALISQAVYPKLTPLAGQSTVFTAVDQHSIGENVMDPSVVNQPSFFYLYDSYDSGPALSPDGLPMKGTSERHYALDLTGQAGGTDSPNQLKYPNAPPDHTVVTYCTYHGGNVVPVLFLNGNVKPVALTDWQAKGPLGF